MPDWLQQLLEQGAKIKITNQINKDGRITRIETFANEFKGYLPILSQLSAQDNNVSRVYLCHPNVTHIVKMAREGGFCGYRNIQMMISYIQATESQGFAHFPGQNPSILHLQDMIERAWDMDFGVLGRIETGVIRGTRKYIGTPEVCARGLMGRL